MSPLRSSIRQASVVAAVTFVFAACAGSPQPEPEMSPVASQVTHGSPDSHEGHGSMQEPAVAQHEGMNHDHAAMSAEPVASVAKLDPAVTLRPDALDAAVTISVAEATKAANNVPDGDIRHVVPGEDDENPPTPQAAVRDGAAREVAGPDHSGHAQPATTKPAESRTGHEGHSGAKAAPPAERKPAATIYTCPMHPEVTSDKPGTCPKCGMALVKKK